LSVIDRNGVTLERLAQLWDTSTGGPAEAVTISLTGAPIGGSLLVQISTPSSVTAGGSTPSPASPLDSGALLPFMMDVQRMEVPAANPAGAAGSAPGPLSSPVQLGIGALPGSSDPHGQVGRGGDWSALPETSNSIAATAEQGLAAQAGDRSTSDESSPEEFNGRIATGPLAGRTAAPLGPNLSTVMIDPVPATDRHERALSQEIAANDVDGRRELLDRSTDAGDRDPASDRSVDGSEAVASDHAEGAVTSIAGLGPMHLKVSRPGADVPIGIPDDLDGWPPTVDGGNGN
jgi:hypothetical protein